MKTAKILIIAATAATCAMAAGNSDAVTKAAQNPSDIPAIVKELGTGSVSSFASEVIAAIAAMPKPPVAKVYKMADASKALIAQAEDGKLADVIASLVSNVPFEALPAWTSLVAGSVNNEIKDMEEAAYQKLVEQVLKNIGSIKDLSNDDKTVISAFALKLLARSSDPELESVRMKDAVKTAPAAYAAQLDAALLPTLKGDYAAVLGDIEIIELPKKDIAEPKAIVQEMETASSDTETYLPEGPEAIALKDIVGDKGKDKDKDKGKDKDSKKKPPVPPFYKEQM